MRRYLIVLSLALVPILSLGSLLAQDVASFEKRTTVKVLKNGLTVVLCERPEAPVFSFFTIVDAGAVQDPQGQSGMAHMFEHEAFKGTDRIGTTDYAKEQVALAKVEQAWADYDREDRREPGRDAKRVADLKAAFDKAREGDAEGTLGGPTEVSIDRPDLRTRSSGALKGVVVGGAGVSPASPGSETGS